MAADVMVPTLARHWDRLGSSIVLAGAKAVGRLDEYSKLGSSGISRGWPCWLPVQQTVRTTAQIAVGAVETRIRSQSGPKLPVQHDGDADH